MSFQDILMNRYLHTMQPQPEPGVPGEPEPDEEEKEELLPDHDNIRGPGYYE